MSSSNLPLVSQTKDQGRDGDVVGPIPVLRRVPSIIAEIADGWQLAYRMPAVRGGQTVATGMLFLPRGVAPSAGLPLIVFGHDTEGWAPPLAPSVYVQNASHLKYGGHWKYQTWIRDLLAAGYAVVAVDYEGLGDTSLGVPATGHPYFNKKSEGRSITMAAVAARRALGARLSGAWAAAGHSQGGRATIAAAELSHEAANIEPVLRFRGGIAAAPTTNVMARINERWGIIKERSAVWDVDGAIPYLTLITAYGVLYVKAMITAGYDIDPAQLLGSRALRFYNERLHLDIWSLSTEVADDITIYAYGDVTEGDLNSPASYPGLRVDAANASRFKEAVDENEIGRVKVPGEILVVQGTHDPYTTFQYAMPLVSMMLANGTKVRFSAYADADHYGVLQLPEAKAVMREFLVQLFASDGGG